MNELSSVVDTRLTDMIGVAIDTCKDESVIWYLEDIKKRATQMQQDRQSLLSACEAVNLSVILNDSEMLAVAICMCNLTARDVQVDR